MSIIPIVHCFDNRYVIPAGVAFLSMLEQASSKHAYYLYVLHSDITPENQKKLKDLVSVFSNASLNFIQMDQKCEDLFNRTKIKGHYSKEMYYKLCLPSLFKKYDKVIVSDVDVVYQGDISGEFLKFDVESEFLLAAVKTPCLTGSFLEHFHDEIYPEFTPEERQYLCYGAGYMIFNLKKMRSQKIEQKFFEFVQNNTDRIKQPEQDTINLVCQNRIKKLPLASMVCTYDYDLFQTEESYQNDLVYSEKEIRDALSHPIQVHYATSIKPWNTPTCTKAELWYSYLTKTSFFSEQMNCLEKIMMEKQKITYTLFKKIPVLKIKKGKAKLFGIIPLSVKKGKK